MQESARILTAGNSDDNRRIAREDVGSLEEISD
jgi:hypothetical protein